MDIEKAIEILSETRLQYMYSIPNCMEYADEDTVEASESNQNVVDAIDIAIQALEKQVAKKVIVKDWSPAKCPTCGMGLSELIGDGYYEHFTWIKRCPNPDCAQLLKWEDEDD